MTSDQLQICHLAANSKGGAARAALRLHRGLVGAGHSSRFVVDFNGAEVDDVEGMHADVALPCRLARALRSKRMELELFPYRRAIAGVAEPFRGDRSRHGTDLVHCLPQREILNLHWTTGFVDFEAIPRLARQSPLVWTLHDMNPFTGGCHYSNACCGYAMRCGACPELQSTNADDVSAQILKRKIRLIKLVEEGRLVIVSPSRWLAKASQQSAVFGHLPHEVIPYGLDLEAFRPRDRDTARSVFGLRPEEKVVAVVSESLQNKRKGMQHLASISESFPSDRLVVIAVGAGSVAPPERGRVINLGTIRHDGFLSLVFNAADVFVCPSIADNFPNTVLESLGSGCPVVGFNVGGMPDMVHDGVNGFLADVADPATLGAHVARILETSDTFVMRESARSMALENYSLDLQASRYVDLYRRFGQCTPPGSDD